MSIYEKIDRLFIERGTSVYKEAEKLNFGPVNLAILAGNMEYVKANAQETYQNVLSCAHQADARSPFIFVRDVVASWVYEEYIRAVLIRCGIDVELAGADKNRTILASSKVSNGADYIWHLSDGSTRTIELVCDYSGFWSAKCVMHLRDNKYIHLTESESILLGIDCKNHMFYLIDFAKGKIHAQYLPHHHAYGDKPAYAIELNEGSDVMMRPCKVGELKREFLRIA